MPNWGGSLQNDGCASTEAAVPFVYFFERAATDFASPEFAWAARQVIPTPSHVLDRISPIFPPFSPVFCAFSPSRRGGSNEPQAVAQRQETVRPGTVSPA